ncbi:MAG: glycoside hydrolase family 130 protein [Melioribacteraceae bacterium]|nr:glycoside hydrolase family 130 protein [Melioribacteraceae bacterium]MCF8264475.1 glycoside hydrolase family 130 protein [Melioribacteraceae bacterium]
MEILRYNSNPILTKADVSFKVNSIFNPGAVKFNNKYILVCRVEMPNGRSSFIKAESDDGYSFTVDKKLLLTPESHTEFYEYVEWGIEDPRITQIEDKFYLTYTGYSKNMPLVILAETEDFKNFKIHGPISEPSNKDCSIFPEKINGYYWKVDRPSAESRRDIWVSKSPDLIHWGSPKIVMQPEQGTWEQDKIGASSNPIRTKDGWLMLYHGVRGFGISSIYKLGVVLLDINEPWKVIGKSREPILSPDQDYERIGDVGNVVFSNGWIVEDDERIKVYYSGADTNICVADTSINELIEVCK